MSINLLFQLENVVAEIRQKIEQARRLYEGHELKEAIFDIYLEHGDEIVSLNEQAALEQTRIAALTKSYLSEMKAAQIAAKVA